MKVYELPGGTFASAVHHGAFTGFAQLHQALLRWIDGNGYQITGPFREVYHRHDPRTPHDSVTEVQYPVAPGN